MFQSFVTPPYRLTVQRGMGTEYDVTELLTPPSAFNQAWGPRSGPGLRQGTMRLVQRLGTPFPVSLDPENSSNNGLWLPNSKVRLFISNGFDLELHATYRIKEPTSRRGAVGIGAEQGIESIALDLECILSQLNSLTPLIANPADIICTSPITLREAIAAILQLGHAEPLSFDLSVIPEDCMARAPYPLDGDSSYTELAQSLADSCGGFSLFTAPDETITAFKHYLVSEPVIPDERQLFFDVFVPEQPVEFEVTRVDISAIEANCADTFPPIPSGSDFGSRAFGVYDFTDSDTFLADLSGNEAEGFEVVFAESRNQARSGSTLENVENLITQPRGRFYPFNTFPLSTVLDGSLTSALVQAPGTAERTTFLPQYDPLGRPTTIVEETFTERFAALSGIQFAPAALLLYSTLAAEPTLVSRVTTTYTYQNAEEALLASQRQETEELTGNVLNFSGVNVELLVGVPATDTAFRLMTSRVETTTWTPKTTPDGRSLNTFDEESTLFIAGGALDNFTVTPAQADLASPLLQRAIEALHDRSIDLGPNRIREVDSVPRAPLRRPLQEPTYTTRESFAEVSDPRFADFIEKPRPIQLPFTNSQATLDRLAELELEHILIAARSVEIRHEVTSQFILSPFAPGQIVDIRDRRLLRKSSSLSFEPRENGGTPTFYVTWTGYTLGFLAEEVQPLPQDSPAFGQQLTLQTFADRDWFVGIPFPPFNISASPYATVTNIFVSAGSLPPGMAIVQQVFSGFTVWRVQGTVPEGGEGTYNATISATDGVSTVSNPITINIGQQRAVTPLIQQIPNVRERLTIRWNVTVNPQPRPLVPPTANTAISIRWNVTVVGTPPIAANTAISIRWNVTPIEVVEDDEISTILVENLNEDSIAIDEINPAFDTFP